MIRTLKVAAFFLVFTCFFQSPETAFTQTWAPTNGPFGGGISCLAKSNTYLFAGAGGGGIYGNGAYRSANNGASWTPINGLSTLNAFVVSGSYLVAASGGSIYRSGNNGDTWSQCNYAGTSVPNALITDGTTVFAGGYSGFFISTDNGLTWTASNANFPGIVAPNVPDIWSFAICSGYLYAGTSQQGIFRSSNNGATWSAVNGGIVTNPLQLAYYTFANLVTSGTDVFAGAIGQGIYRLTNNGTTWTKESTGLSANAKSVLSLMVKDDLLYIGGNDGLWSSNNSGTISWTQIKAGEQFGKLLPSGSNIFAGLSTKGVYLSADNGYMWTPVNQGLGSVSTRKITKGNGSEILAATYEGYLYSSSDEGANWTVGNIHLETGPCLHGTTLFAGTDGNLFRSTDNGATWQMLPQFYELTMGPAMAFYSKGDTIFAGAGGVTGMYYSTDNGDTWNETSGIWNLNPNGGYPTVISITSVGSTMYAGTINGVFKSVDNGLTWTSCYPAMANIPIRCLASRGRCLFAGTSDFYEDPNLPAIGVYRSEDNGASWVAVNSGLGNLDIGSLVVYGADLYAGTHSGVFKSTNDGATWTGFNEGFSVVPNATSLYIQGNYIYANNWLITTPVSRRALTGSAPALPGAIVGSAAPCIGSLQTYSVTSVPGVTYSWQVPSNWTITAGSGTNSITVIVGSFPGLILVIPANGWGTGPAQYLIASPNTLGPNQPSSITGTTNPLEGTSLVYSVVSDPGVSYAWAFPSGWIQTAGGTTNSVTVTVGAGSGNISVTPSTPCGTGTSRTLAVVTSPANISVSNITIVNGQDQCYNASGTIIVAGGANTFLVQNGGQATFIAGQMISFLPGTKVETGGYLLGTITTTGQYCGALPAAKSVAMAAEGLAP
ncbi:MAG: hypothetical protein NT040_01930, partial [Bacteroidetes bacterium]|nr:hypothetical protein [Bacteroidota bacterium]